MNLIFLFVFSLQVGASEPNPKALSSYSFDASLPLTERIADMPDWLLDLWRKSDEAPDYKTYQPSAQEKLAWTQAVEELPPKMKDALKNRLIAVYFISGLKGNGLTDWVLDASSRVYVYMALNPDSFHQTLSETLTQRDASVFQGIVPLKIDAGKGAPGILYTVAHESAHAFDYVMGLTPYVEPGMATSPGRPSNVSWDAWSSYAQPRAQHDFPERKRLHFYNFSPPELKPREALQVYDHLSRSPFPSLYGSRNWADDVADLFVFYHLTRTLGRPYRIRIKTTKETWVVLEPMSNPILSQRAERILAPIY